MERTNSLIEQSAIAKLRGNLSGCLEKSKETFNKEKKLRQSKEAQNLLNQLIQIQVIVQLQLTHALYMQTNFDKILQQNTVSKLLQIKFQGQKNQIFQLYQEIIKCKQYYQPGRLRLIMGNIYFEQKKYPTLIKIYKIVLDLIPASSKEMRFTIQKHIGHVQVRLGIEKIKEALSTYKQILNSPQFSTGFNLMISEIKIYQKDYLVNLLTILIEGEVEEENNYNKGIPLTDKLREDTKKRRREAIYYIVTSAKFNTPLIEDNQLKNLTQPEAETEKEICQAIAFLKRKNIERSIATLKGFENKDKQILSLFLDLFLFIHFFIQIFENLKSLIYLLTMKLTIE